LGRVSLTYNQRLVLDAIGVGCVVLILGASVYSLVLDVMYWGPSGIVLGRFLNRNDGGGVHSLAILLVTVPFLFYTRRVRINWIMAPAMIMLADYYHEAIWNIPYYLRYSAHLGDLWLYVAVGLGCFVFYGAALYKGKAHNFSHVLYLLPWLVMITLYLVLVGHFSEDLYGPQAYYRDPLVGLYENFEVGLFALLLVLGLLRVKAEPIIHTAYAVPVGR
jgi:hypothetical protein